MRLLSAVFVLASLSGAVASAQVSRTPDIAAGIVALGPELSREMVGGTMRLYKPLHATDHEGGFVLTADENYGDHERHRLDVYAPEKADGTQPIIVFAHGGGFVRGDKGDVAHIGRWLARRGMVAVLINYRLAPEHKWPSGIEDVGLVLDWLKAHPDLHRGDAAKIVLAGHSAGSAHVAGYAFHEDLQKREDGVVGVVLISPPTVSLTGRELDPKRDALYFAESQEARAEQSVATQLDGRKLPVLVAFAEYEPAFIHDQTRQLIAGLFERDGVLPLIATAAGHNHISIVEHFGTADETLGPDLLEFIGAVQMD